jgi:hypothetical protein
MKEKGQHIHWPTFVFTNLAALLITALTAFVIHPLATRYWQSPHIEVLGAQPLHLYQDVQPELPATHNNKMFAHTLAFIIKVKNASSTPAIINAAMIFGCAALPDPLAAEENLPMDEQVDLKGKNIADIHKRHEHTVQSIRVSGEFQPHAQTSVVVGAYSTEYVGVLFPTSTGPYYQVSGSASLKGDCSGIATPNRWPSASQLLEDAHPRGLFPKTLRKEFFNQQLALVIFGTNDQFAVTPELIRQLVSVRQENWENLLLPQMYENPQNIHPPVRKKGS